MSYETHGFVSGMKLSGAAMAEMDQQIADNESDIRTLEAGLSAVPAQRGADIRTLSLTADADTISLMYGNELLAVVAIPDVSEIIYCTGLTATGTLTGLYPGDTAQITAARQPSNCNQTIKHRSTDTSVATVSSTGLVTAVGKGAASIQVLCGSYTVTLPVRVSVKVDLTGCVSDDIGWLSMGQSYGAESVTFVTDGANAYVGNIPYSFDKFRIRPGETLTINMLDSAARIELGFIFEAETGETMAILDKREDDDRYLIQHAVQVAASGRTSPGTGYTYTNTGSGDMFVAVALSGVTAANVAGKVEFVISPPSA